MAYYNPYEEELLRRRQQQEMNQPQFQQPTPLANLPLYSGPELPQWMPMGDNGGQQMQDAGAGMADLIKRFRKPKTTGEHGPVLIGGGAEGHGY